MINYQAKKELHSFSAKCVVECDAKRETPRSIITNIIISPSIISIGTAKQKN